MIAAPDRRSTFDRWHDALLVALIVLRPLVWSVDYTAWDHIAWMLLVIVALVVLSLEGLAGRRPWLHWGPGGIIAGVLIAGLLPATVIAPEPTIAWGTLNALFIQIGFAFWLCQVVPGRERLAFAALLGGAAVEVVVALLQPIWTLPAMAAKLAAHDPTVMAMETAKGELAERIANGGMFGTFTLANTLAAFLLLVLPLIVWQRTVLTALFITGLIAIAGTKSKGAYAALVAAGSTLWLTTVRGRWRWLPLAGVSMLAVAIVSIPVLKQGLAASAEVRLGYWRGAATLIAEAPLGGHGLHSFATHAGRVIAPGAEVSRNVHNDLLEAAVDGGIPAALLLAALLGWLVIGARGRNEPLAATAPPLATLPLLGILPLFAAIGMLSSNTSWWPLGNDDATWWLWPMLLTGLAIAVIHLAMSLPWPPAWAFRLALGAFALHCLVDFDLHSPGIWGTLTVVAVLAANQRQGPARRATWAGVSIFTVCLLIFSWMIVVLISTQ